MRLRNMAAALTGLGLFAFGALAQQGSMEGTVKGPDGKPMIGAMVKIDRTDIKAHYQVKTDKKGHYFHAGLPVPGTYNVSITVDGKDQLVQQGVPLRGGDPVEVPIDLSQAAAAQQAAEQKAEAQQAALDARRHETAAEKAAREKSEKEREEALKKNKELNDAFNAGIAASQAKQYDVAVTNFTKASELDPKQHVVWAQLAEAEVNLAGTKSGADQEAEMKKGLDAYAKAIELKPDDAGYHNNYALALARAKKFSEAQDELTKAATLDPTNAGRYYYNLGALLVNAGQNEPAGQAFKAAIDKDPNYADAQYQYGVYLLSKASVGADGKVIPVPGTADAFQKYLQLKPDGPFAEQAKSMLTSLGETVDTSYKAPSNKKGKK
ncbi:MAG TPA: carboxypeptidase regulatory-like domain-containing protein [Bryobacteraceae bacterium]|nr:carboxypeptidase regulatory-like domain-containing protein [Bryobacteraceae bacterium]